MKRYKIDYLETGTVKEVIWQVKETIWAGELGDEEEVFEAPTLAEIIGAATEEFPDVTFDDLVVGNDGLESEYVVLHRKE